MSISHSIPRPKALLIGIDTPSSAWPTDVSLDELAELARTAGVESVDYVIQRRPFPDPHTYVGSGKVTEIQALIQGHSIELVITDDELTTSQQRHLEDELKVKILDRTALILDIFAYRAKTYEAKLQVELAQLQYLAPRLTRMWTHLSRLGGGIGTRGPGESQLEVDKRQIRKRISVIQQALKKVERQRMTRRELRHQIPLQTAALVGYTNAGKSTLMNALTQANILAEDRLFATLDPTTRKVQLPSHEEFLVSDTVGFIRKLPHQLITSFHATLEEVRDATILIHVVDVSTPYFEEMLQTSLHILKDIGASDKPTLYVFNKVDLLEDLSILDQLRILYPHSVAISAEKRIHFSEFLAALDRLLSTFRKVIRLSIPFHRMDIVNLLHEKGKVLDKQYTETGLEITVDIPRITGEKIQGLLSISKG